MNFNFFLVPERQKVVENRVKNVSSLSKGNSVPCFTFQGYGIFVYFFEYISINSKKNPED